MILMRIIDFLLSTKGIALCSIITLIIVLLKYIQYRRDKVGKLYISIKPDLLDPKNKNELPILSFEISIYYSGDTKKTIKEIGFIYKKGINNYVYSDREIELTKDKNRKSVLIPWIELEHFYNAKKIYLVDVLDKKYKFKINNKKYKIYFDKFDALLSECTLIKEANEIVNNKN